MANLRSLNGNKGGTASMSKETNLDTLHHTALRVKDVKETVAWYTERFRCKVEYQDATWAMLEFENVRLAFVLAEQHPPHVAILGDPALFGEPSIHRDGTASVYVKDPNGNNVEIMALAPEDSPAAKL
jgi:catechol 2,3-dioxygenase-like lactoylglutathione lyase family enzyme